ncbi:MAG: PqqD family protein [Candidatus Helarchaeota archaeon]|nr:PqqD family protein [Candidatus Helarchaeota archaeon]
MSKLKLKEDVDVEEKEEYISRELGAILINYETSKYYETNDTGTYIIKLLQAAKTAEEIVEAICKDYEVDQTTALTDLNEFLDILKKYDLIED